MSFGFDIMRVPATRRRSSLTAANPQIAGMMPRVRPGFRGAISMTGESAASVRAGAVHHRRSIGRKPDHEAMGHRPPRPRLGRSS